MESFFRYYVAAMTKGSDEFIAEHCYLYLLKPPDPNAPKSTGSGGADEFGDEAEEPLPGNELETGSLNERSPMAGQWSVAAVRKRPGFAPYNRIVVGRWTSCDIVLPFSSVSALHAHFHLGENGSVVGLSDRRSSNGTFINGRRLAPGEIATVGAGDTVRFGSVDLELVDGAELYARLKDGL